MANQDDLQQTLRMGIEAARRGDKASAQVLLQQVVNADPNNELAWMWLASAVDSLEERRACLQRALQINPDNARAREALQRLQPDSPRAVSDTPRPRRPRPTAPPAERSGPSPVAILVGVVVALAAITALIFAIVSSQQPAPLDTDALAAALSPSVTSSPDPESFTATPSPFMVIVTPNITLPPTFTPTFTPTASETPLPSPTTIPMSAFTLLYTSLDPGDVVPALYRAAGDGSDEQLLATGIYDVAIDPSGERVAFVREVAEVEETVEAVIEDEEGPISVIESETRIITELFIAPVDDINAAVQITDFGSTISSPTWAPNGIQLAFVSDYDGDEEIWTLTDDGENVIQVTDNESVDRDPAWSPDGTQIVFVSDQDSPGLTRLYSMTPEGENITRLNSLGGNTYQPAWSPDGTQLVFVNDSGGDGDIYISDAQGQSSLLLTIDDAGAEDRRPAFTPDSQWVAFISNRGSDNFQTYVTDLQGTMITRITENERDDQELGFRPELIFRLRTN